MQLEYCNGYDDKEGKSDNLEQDIKDKLSKQENKNILCPIFKTALEIRKSEKILENKPHINKDIFELSILKGDNRNTNTIGWKNRVDKNLSLFTKDVTSENSNLIKEHSKESPKQDKTTDFQILSDFMCARKIHEENEMLLKNHNKKSRKSLKESKKKSPKNKKALPVNVTPNKSVYEQILQSAKSRKVTKYNESESHSVNIRNEKESKYFSKEKRKNIDLSENNVNTKSHKKMKFEGKECSVVNKEKIINTDDVVVSEISVDKNDKIDNEKTEVDNFKDKNVFTAIKNAEKEETLKQENIIIEYIETKKSLQEKHDKKTRLKQHTDKDKKKFVSADKITQFKTAEILKSYLMKYYPSERIPDRTTFSKTCREMHYILLGKKIFGKV